MATYEEVQAVGYYILGNLEDICNELGIKMVLQSGTCLGAVRHNGFIPWDDDIDVMMTYRDYKKLRKYFVKKGNKINDLSLSDFATDPQTPYCLPKIRYNKSRIIGVLSDELEMLSGIGLDIFIYSYKSNNPKGFEIQKKLFGLTQMLHEKYLHRKYIRKGILSENVIYNYPINVFANKAPDWVRILTIKLFQNIIAFLGSKKSKKYFAMTSYITVQPTPDCSIFDETIRHRFGEREFNIPKDYDRYLRTNYGDDYMTPIAAQHLNIEQMEIFD
ncbi:MAG: LicD family protein [Clostridia bacterium]|nr:LicD family protein [Clostridia bacterium]